MTFVGKFADWKRLDAVLYAAQEPGAPKTPPRIPSALNSLEPYDIPLIRTVLDKDCNRGYYNPFQEY